MTAFRATFSDMKLVKTRQVAQLIFEIPIEDFDAAYEVLGGMPVPSKERWFGIAALQSPTPQAEKESEATATIRTPARPSLDKPSEKAKQDWREVKPSAQAAMRCDQAAFWAFLREEHSQRVATKDDAATAVRKICGVNSRAHFNDNHVARVAWHQLDSQYQAWLEKERVGA